MMSCSFWSPQTKYCMIKLKPNLNLILNILVLGLTWPFSSIMYYIPRMSFIHLVCLDCGQGGCVATSLGWAGWVMTRTQQPGSETRPGYGSEIQGPVIPSSSQHHTQTQYGTKEELFSAFLTSFDSFHDAVWNMDMMIMYISMFTLSARRAPWAQQARPCILMCSVRGCLDSWWEEREGSDLRDHLEAPVNKPRTWLPSLESYGMSCREAIKREEWKQKHCVVISCLCWIDLNISFT